MDPAPEEPLALEEETEMKEHTLTITLIDDEVENQKSITCLIDTISNLAKLQVTRYFRGVDLTVSVRTLRRSRHDDGREDQVG